MSHETLWRHPRCFGEGALRLKISIFPSVTSVLSQRLVATVINRSNDEKGGEVVQRGEGDLLGFTECKMLQRLDVSIRGGLAEPRQRRSLLFSIRDVPFFFPYRAKQQSRAERGFKLASTT